MITQSIKDMLRLSECGHITNKRKINLFAVFFTKNFNQCIYGCYILSIKPRNINNKIGNTGGF